MSKRARNNQRGSYRPAGGVGALSNRKSESVANGKSDRAAILWYSNSPHASTGYGQQTEQVTTRLLADGHKVAISSNYGYEGGYPKDFSGLIHYPRGFETYSNDIVTANAQHWSMMHPQLKPMLITLFDVWVFKGTMWSEHTVHSWVPIDHSICPPDVLKWLQQPNVRPITMSQHGHKMLAREGVESIYIPHAIEKVFKPTEIFIDERGDHIPGHHLMGMAQDHFVVMMNSANKGTLPNRKSFGEALLAFSIFAQNKPDARMYLHTEDVGAVAGINLRKLVEALGLEDKVVFADQYALRLGYPKEVLAAMYSAADVLLAPSMGEGFGIPVIEAQACGTPVIVSNATSQPELVGDGWLVAGQPFWNPTQNAWLHMPSVPSIVDALNSAYDRGKQKSQKAMNFAAQYDADKVYQESWRPLISSYLQETA